MTVSRYYQIELEKLIAEYEKISIFTKHPGTLGAFREQLLKDYLRKFIPSFLSVNSGFVSDYKNAEKDSIQAKQTRQIDLIIHDENYYTPFLKTSEYSIIEPESLYAAIEIKSTLTFHKSYGEDVTTKSKPSEKYPFDDGERYYRWSGTLIDAFENIRSITILTNQYKKKVFYGIFAYESKVDYKTFLHAFDTYEIQRQLGISHIDEIPTYVCILNGELLYFGRVSMFDDEDKGFDESQSEMTYIGVNEKNKEFPLQFFTNALKINVDSFLTNKTPHKSGLFTAGLGEISFWNQHFDLNSDYKNHIIK